MLEKYKIAAGVAAVAVAALSGYWIAAQRYEAKMQTLRADLLEAMSEQRAELLARAEKEKAVRMTVEEDYAKAVRNLDVLGADVERLRRRIQGGAGSAVPEAGTAAGGLDDAAVCRRALGELTQLASESAAAADKCNAQLGGLQRWARSVTE